jgi:uncharacterized protein (TIGR00730 family)
MSNAKAQSVETELHSVCLFCGSSNAANPDFLKAAAAFGAALAAEGLRLVYGGGGIGLMGAAAKAAHAEGGEVLGVMPDFLRRHEVIYDEVETIVVKTMHERKRIMFENSDAFAIFPGGVGTLEEVVELMSWRRLDLHRKPIVFLDMHGFWRPFLALIDHTVAEKLTPPWLPDTFKVVTTVEAVLPALRQMRMEAESGPGFDGYAKQNAEVAAKL